MPANVATQFRAIFSQNGALLGSVSATGGFISDVLQPIAPFAAYILILSIIIVNIAGIGALLLPRFRELLLNVLVIGLLACVVSGLVMLLQSYFSEEDQGVLATHIPQLNQIQEQLGLMQADISAIKTNTHLLLKESAINNQLAEATQKNTVDIKTSISGVSTDVKTLSEKVTSQSGIILEPKSAEDYYHNARIYELSGDYLQARTAYLAYFKQVKSLPSAALQQKLDPHLRFQTILILQDGRQTAQNIYQTLFAASTQLTDQYALILLEPEAQRIKALQQWVQDHPNFIPAYYQLSKEYSTQNINQPTFYEKRLEKQYLQTFIKQAKSGSANGYFLNKDFLQIWENEAQQRLKTLQEKYSDQLAQPINFVVSRYQNHWRIFLAVKEPHTKLMYKLENQTEFNPVSGSVAADVILLDRGYKEYVDLQGLSRSQRLEFTYTDQNGVQSPSASFYFDYEKEVIAASIHFINISRDVWVTVDNETGYHLGYDFLDQLRCGVKMIWLGYDEEIPTKPMLLKPCDMTQPFQSSTEDWLYWELDNPVSVVSIKIDLLNGESTDIMMHYTGFKEEDRENFKDPKEPQAEKK